jgi:hypothetical protein
VHGGNCCLEGEAARPAPPQRLVDQLAAFADGLAVPAGAVLFLQQQQPTVGSGAGRPAGVGEQQQGQQPPDLAVVGHEGGQHPGQVQGALDQVGAHELVT